MSQAITLRDPAAAANPLRQALSLPPPVSAGALMAKADEAYGGDGSDYVSPVPRRLRFLRAAALAAVTAWAIAAGAATVSVRTATQTVGHDAAPSVVAAEKVRTLLADANGNFANVLLVRDGEDGPFMSAYRQDMRDAQTALAAAAGNVTYGAEETGPILTLMRGVAEYADLVGRARAASAAPDGGRSAFADAKAADALMHFTLLPAAAALERANHDHLAEGYAAHSGRIAMVAILAGLLAAAAVGAIALLQLELGRSTRRIVDPFAAAAGAAVLVVATWAMLATVRAEANLRSAKSDAFESFAALSTAQAYAADANAAESFWLLAGPDAAARKDYAEAFAARARRLWPFPAAGAGTGGPPRGLLGAASGNVTFPGEGAALQRAVDAWTAYLSIDARIRALSDAGKAQDATALCVGTGEGQSNWAFARFGQALDRAAAINKDAFDEAIAASESLSGKHVVIGLALAWLVACAGTWLAAARRLRAYEF